MSDKYFLVVTHITIPLIPDCQVSVENGVKLNNQLVDFCDLFQLAVRCSQQAVEHFQT